MHTQALQLLNTLTFLSLLHLPSSSGAEVAASTPPQECTVICAPVVQLIEKCGVTSMADVSSGGMTKDGDAKDVPMKPREEQASKVKQYICDNKSTEVKNVFGLCASCMAQSERSSNQTTVGGMDFMSNFMLAQDINRIMSECAFPVTSYTPTATSNLQGAQVQETPAVMTIMASNSTGAVGRKEAAFGVGMTGLVIASVGLGAGILIGVL